MWNRIAKCLAGRARFTFVFFVGRLKGKGLEQFREFSRSRNAFATLAVFFKGWKANMLGGVVAG